jgi:hypothetical protein
MYKNFFNGFAIVYFIKHQMFNQILPWKCILDLLHTINYKQICSMN